MSEIADQIDAVIGTRRRRLPEVQAEIARWRRVDDAAAELAQAVTRLRDDPATPAQVAAHLGQLRVVDARPAVAAVIESLQRVASRIGRGTVCIGVGGAPRAGKSTLLQSLSGLSEAWLPTGGGTLGTAVSTRFFHSPGRRRASLELHTFDSFRAAHLQPGHVAARLGEAPADVEAFRATTYPDPDAAGLSPGQRAQLARLRDMQEALWSYEALLDRQGGVLELTGDELDRLPEYLTCPTGGKPAAHRYLAVREARIECPFPHAEVGAITMVDLPGTGDATQAHRRRLGDLRPDMDLALLVKRTVGATTHWGPADAAAMASLDRARGLVSRRGDFVVVVLNTGAGAGGPDLAHNGGADVPFPPVLEVDGRDPADVSARLLRPVLQHLARRLPAMDAEVFAGVRAGTGAVREDLVGLAVSAKAVLHHVCGPAAGADEDTFRRADTLHRATTVALRALLATLRSRASAGDPAFTAAVDELHTEVVGWIRNGFGAGWQLWCASVRRGLLRDGPDRFARAELGRVRMAVGRRYGQLDRLLRRRLEQAWTDVAATLPSQFAALLCGRTGDAALTRLGELAAEAAQPCPVIRSAVDELLAVRLDYHTHLYPRISSALGLLDLPVPRPPTPTASWSTDDPAALCRILAGRAERAASHARARLLREAKLPGQVTFAAVERFSEALLSSAAEWEIRQLARSYRRTLWAGAGYQLDNSDASVARVTRAADTLLAATGELVSRPP